MKTTKLVNRLNEFFDTKSRYRKKQKIKLKDLLRKLRGRQKKLERKLINISDEEKRNETERELKIIRLQREKALKLLIDLKSDKK